MVNWGLAAVVGGLVETAYFGILPMSLARRKDTPGAVQTATHVVPSEQMAITTRVTTADSPENTALNSEDLPVSGTKWSKELFDVFDTLTVCLPDVIDVSQIAVQAGVSPHLIGRSGDKAPNRWQELIDRALIDGGDDRLELILTRALRRSGSDPRLVAAVNRWRKTAAHSQ